MQQRLIRFFSLVLLTCFFTFCSEPKTDVLSGVNQSGGVTPLNPAPGNLTFYWIDVEGGAATLIVTPTGESILVDTGNPGNRDAERIFKVTQEAGLKQIDHLITTHWHIDHYGGAAELTQKIPVITLHDKGIPDMLPEDKQFTTRIQPYRDMAVQKRSVIEVNQLLNLKSLPGNLPKLSLRLLGFDKKFAAVSDKSKPGLNCETVEKAIDTSDNANSTVLVLDYGMFRFFDGGDLTWNVEKTLVCPQNTIGTVDVYQVNHHGLDQSNNPALVKSLAPTVAIMNNGTKKGGGPETISTLKNMPSLQGNYQLHKNIRPDSLFNTDNAFIANFKENCTANYIKMVVAPDGNSYTVSIPGTKHSKTYATKTSH